MHKVIIRFLCFLTGYVCFWGCRMNVPKDEYEDNGYSIDLDKDFSKEVSLFDFCTGIELRQFDGAPEALMDESTILCKAFGDSSIFFLSSEDHLIREFDYHGKLLDVADRYGRGPGEFTMANDMIVNKYSNTLDILNPIGEIYQYSLDSLLWTRTIDFSDNTNAVHYFYALSLDEYLLFSMSDYPQLFIFSEGTGVEDVEIDNIIPTWITMTSFSGGGTPFYEFGDEVKYSIKYEGSIYALDRTSMNLQYRWDMGKHQIDINQIEPDKDFFFYSNLLRTTSHKYATCFNRVAESERYIIQNFRFRGSYSWNSLIFDKAEQSINVIKKTKEKVILLAGTVKDNCMYYVANAEYVNLFLNDSLLYDEESKDVYRQINDESNVVLIKYHLRQ